MPQALILFDVDGTLLLTGGASSRCHRFAGQQILGDAYKDGEIKPGGLDHRTAYEVVMRCGAKVTAEMLARYRDLYLGQLEVDLKERRGAKALPGILTVLEELRQRQNVTLGLLTGNFQRAVELKLAAAGIDRSLFVVGAFTEDGEDRPALARVAMAQFQEKFGKAIEPSQVIVIGDTPSDIDCAQKTGCRALAVATGRYSVEELRACKPDVVVASFADARALYELVDLVM